jgi:glycosyltransferase involved in cell wall biosynthesis
MLEAISGRARCLIVTGNPVAAESNSVDVKAAPKYDRRSLRHRAASWLRYAVAATPHALFAEGRPALFVTTNPPFMPHVAWLLHRLRGMPYAVLVWDLFPHSLVAAGWMLPSHPMVRLWSALNRRAFRDAEVTIALGERMADVIRGELQGSDDCTIRIVPNWGQTDYIKPLPKEENEFAASEGQLGKITVLYSGNLGGTHGLEALVEAAEILRHDERFSFLIIGDGRGRETAEREVAARHLQNVRLLGLQPWERVPLTLASGDIAVVSQAPNTENFSFPSKVYSSLAAGSAILGITRQDSDLAELVRTHDVGVVVEWGNAREIAKALRMLADDPERLARLRENARRVALERFSEAAVLRQFQEALAGLTA